MSNDDPIERVTIDSAVCNGKPTIRGLRITVESVLDHLAAGDSTDDIVAAFPVLEPADIRACLAFASRLMARKFTVRAVA